jgi:hypothetical protein
MTSIATDSGVAAAHAVLDHSQGELAELFATLVAVSAEEMQGEWIGEMAGVVGLERLPRPVRKVVHSLLPGWRGKRFTGSVGSNIWGGRTRNTDWLRSRTEHVEQSPVDGRPSLWLDYDISANPVVMRAIRGELRRLDADVVLGRMSWQTRAKLHCVLYFPLRRKG